MALTSPFSKEELELIEFYADELSLKILMLHTQSASVC
jgi:hypothetical protein